MQPSWNNITVQQYQEVYRLAISKDLDDMEKLCKAIAILYDLTESQVDELSVLEFSKQAKQIEFIFNTSEIPGKPVRTIRIGKRKYAIPYKISELTHGQYIDILHFSEKPIENMHFIMARLVQPLQWGLFKKKNKAEEIHEVAEEMLSARLTDVYHSCVFFCKVYLNLIKAMEVSLIAEMTREKKMTPEQAKALLNYSIESMAGFITPKDLRSS